MAPAATQGWDGTALGVLAPEALRTILAVSEDGEPAVALREHVDRAGALIKDVRPNEMAEGYRSCRPWPWIVAGCGRTLPAAVVAALRRDPVLVMWLGEPPPEPLERMRCFARLDDLAAEVNRSLRQTVAGMRLAAGVGVELPGGGYTSSAALQALITSHPHPLGVPLAAGRSAARVLATHGVGCRAVRHRDTGRWLLMNGDLGARR